MVKLNIDLPETFFQEEERSGYLVNAKTKELWAVQLDLLNEFDRVCKKHGLKYILDFGSLLGAIRHKGFIPWDDDLDVSMLREDYDKLMEIGPKEFKHPYFLQNHMTDYRFDGGVVKLRRSDTTCIMKHNIEFHATYNQGIYIDIFVFDNIPSNDVATRNEICKESNRAFYNYLCLCHNNYDNRLFSKVQIKRFLLRLRYVSIRNLYYRWDAVARRYNNAETDYVGTVFFFLLHSRPRRWFDELIEMPFESFKVPVPKNYDDLLHDEYGDYWTPVKGACEHTMVMFDANRPYTDVIMELHN